MSAVTSVIRGNSEVIVRGAGRSGRAASSCRRRGRLVPTASTPGPRPTAAGLPTARQIAGSRHSGSYRTDEVAAAVWRHLSVRRPATARRVRDRPSDGRSEVSHTGLCWSDSMVLMGRQIPVSSSLEAGRWLAVKRDVRLD
jgi:hypothetical protein